MTPETAGWIKEGGLLALALVLGWWAWILWTRNKELEAQILGTTERCMTCSKAHADQILSFGTAAVTAIQQNTEASSVLNRQTEIMARLEEMDRERNSAEHPPIARKRPG